MAVTKARYCHLTVTFYTDHYIWFYTKHYISCYAEHYITFHFIHYISFYAEHYISFYTEHYISFYIEHYISFYTEHYILSETSFCRLYGKRRHHNKSILATSEKQSVNRMCVVVTIPPSCRVQAWRSSRSWRRGATPLRGPRRSRSTWSRRWRRSPPAPQSAGTALPPPSPPAAARTACGGTRSVVTLRHGDSGDT